MIERERKYPKTVIEQLLEASHIDPKSFEAELGLLCHKWMVVKGLDHVIEALHNELVALTGQQDLTIADLPPSQSGTPVSKK